MSDLSPILSLPLLQAAQAQKHVTHNEALRLLDVLVQPAVASRSVTTPPAFPSAGQRFILPAAPTGAWGGQAHAIAFYEQDTWVFLTPQPGWQAHVLDEGTSATWNGTAWRTPSEAPAAFSQLGIGGATADATNRLASASPATLLSHAGAGHQLKINKSAATDTASLLFQTGWSGRAEMGTTGSDAFTIKTSANGSSWLTAVQIPAATGRVSLPQGATLPAGTSAAPALSFDGDPDTGLTRPAADQIALVTEGVARALLGTATLQLDVTLTGTAVQSGATDTNGARLMRVGAFGLGSRIGYSTDLNDISVPGIYGLTNSVTNGPPGIAAASINGSDLQHFAYDGNNHCQVLYVRGASGGISTWLRRRISGAWIAWRMVYDQTTVRGPVSQTGGLPTGALIEYGSNANGDYVRWADGTQICWRATAITTDPAAFTGTPVGIDGNRLRIGRWF